MASRVGLLTLCTLCEKVYDKDRSSWVKMAEYHAYPDRLPDGYAFTGTFCDACQTLYLVMLGRHHTSRQVNRSTLDHEIPAATAPERPLEVFSGLA
jgi:hypothetical protein